MEARPFAGGFVFAEGPRWHNGRLWCSDMHGEAIYSMGATGERETVLAQPGLKPSGLGFTPDGELLFVSMDERAIFKLRDKPVLHADLSGLVDVELNDMVVDGRGRAYVGSYPRSGESGVLIFVDADGSAQIAATDMEFPNGCVITPDGSVLIVTESLGRRLTAFDINPDGSLHNRRVHAAVPNAAGDGLALDAEGGLWSAQPLGRRFVRVLPGGEIVDEIPAGDQMAIACAFGGPDLATLFLLTAPHHARSELLGTSDARILAAVSEIPGAAGPV